MSDLQTVPRNECEQGLPNPDGKCIQGGTLMSPAAHGPYMPEFGSSSTCAAYPIFYMPYVPYETNHISGHEYWPMRTIARGTKLMRPIPP